MDTPEPRCLLCGLPLTPLQSAHQERGLWVDHILWMAQTGAHTRTECALTGGPHHPDKEV